MGILSVGEGHQTMMRELPRPCRYADLTRVSKSAEMQALGVIADGTPKALTDALKAWRAIAPHSHLYVFHTKDFADALRTATGAGSNVTACPVHSYRDLARDPTAQGCLVWASCTPYDAYGVLVKTPVEMAAYLVLRHNRGIYVAHDPAFGVLRWFDVVGLRNRLRYRSVRLRLYQWVCHGVHGIARISSCISDSRFKWRKA